MDITLEALVEAIRDADSLSELKELIGPSDRQAEAVRQRLSAIDAIWDRHGSFNAMPPGTLQRYNQLMEEQRVFENKYC